ncbi:MAG: hypothetical protein AB7R77_12685 [Ilumatobacteraceae bacterium]
MDPIAPLVVAGTGLITAIAAMLRSAAKDREAKERDREAREKAAAAKEATQRLDELAARKDYVEQGFEMMKQHAERQAREFSELKADHRRCEDRNESLLNLVTDLRISVARMEAFQEAQKASGPTIHVPVALTPIPATAKLEDTPPAGIPATPGA